MNRQSKLGSIIEVITNTAIGLVIAFIAQAILFKAYNVPASNHVTAMITFWMTVVSIVRSYLLRRLFNMQCYLKGATAHEFELGPIYLRVTYLRGEYWAWKPWRRFSVRFLYNPFARMWIAYLGFLGMLAQWWQDWEWRYVDPSICCCGATVGQGGDICGHGGCQSIKQNLIESGYPPPQLGCNVADCYVLRYGRAPRRHF